jgi:hypothetical protein
MTEVKDLLERDNVVSQLRASSKGQALQELSRLIG